MLSAKPVQNYEITVALRHISETLKPQCLLDYNAAKEYDDCSDQMGVYYSSIREVRQWLQNCN